MVSIALVAGFLSAASSISKIIEDMPDKYTIEDGQFSTSFKANDKAIDAVEELGLHSIRIVQYGFGLR